MMHRRIVSRKRQLVLLGGCILFVINAIVVRHSLSFLVFWLTIVLFGGGAVWTLLQLLHPRARPDTPLTVQQFQEILNDPGKFSYSNDGFHFPSHDLAAFFRWSAIETIFVFKEDQMTTDELCMDVFFNDRTSIRLTESLRGWYVFNQQLSDRIPVIPSSWQDNIVQPPFQTNLTLLYDKFERSLEAAEAHCYGHS